MNVDFFTTQERLDYLVKNRVKVKVLGNSENDNEFLHIEVTIEHGVDAMKLFHAGISYGVDYIVKPLNAKS